MDKMGRNINDLKYSVCMAINLLDLNVQLSTSLDKTISVHLAFCQTIWLRCSFPIGVFRFGFLRPECLDLCLN